MLNVNPIKITLIILTMLLSACFPDSPTNENSYTSIDFKVVDSFEKTITSINSNTINLSISDNPMVTHWCISEDQTSKPISACNGGEGTMDGWFNTKPTSYTLSNGDGEKSIYFWYKTKTDKVNDEILKTVINLDTVSPTVSIDSYSNINLSNLNNYNLTGSCSDNTNINIIINSSKFTVECSSNSWSFTNNMSSFSDGNHSITVNQKDDAGNISNNAIVNITKDATKPVLNISSPISLLYINNNNQNSFSISGSCQGASGETIFITGSISTTTICSSETFNTNIDYSSIADGNLSLILDVNDSAGNAATSLNFSLIKDTNLPSVSILSPTNNSYINSAGVSSVAVTGSCSEDGEAVQITSPISKSIDCVGNSFSTILDLTSIADASYTLNISQSDKAGNTVSDSINIIKDTIAPPLTQTTFTNQSYSNQSTINIGGSCDSSVNVSISGQDTASVSCNSGVWTYTTDNVSNEIEYEYNIQQTDLAGNSTNLNFSWTRDVTAPTVNSTIINNGDTYIATVFAVIKVSASDDIKVSQIRLSTAHSGTSDCQSEYVDDNWLNYVDSNTPLYYELPSIEGNIKICAWAKDLAGNVSTFSPTQGTEGVNTDSISFEVGTPPVVISFTALNNEAGPNFGTNNFSAGDQILISYNVSDNEGLDNNPINIYWTTNNLDWNPVVENHGSLSGNPTAHSSTYTSFTAPASTYFRLKLIATDSSGNTSITALSQPQNTGNWSIFAGTRDTGIGGSPTAAQLYKSGNAGSQTTVTDPLTNDIYILSANSGLLKFSASTGKITYFLKDATDINFNDGDTLDPNIHTIRAETALLAIDSNGYMYISTNTPYTPWYENIIYQVNLSTLEVKKYFGGGKDNSPSATANTAQVLKTSFAFDESNSLYYFASCSPNTSWDDKVHAYKIMKVSQNPDKTAGAVSHIAGNCTEVALDTTARVATEASLGNGYYYISLTALSVWDNGNKLIYCSYSLGCGKVINGTHYKSSLNPSYGLLYHPVKEKLLWSASNSLFEVILDETAANGDTATKIIASVEAADCLDDGKEALTEACVKINYSPFVGPNNSISFIDGTAVNSNTFFRVRRLTDDNKIKTIAGSLPFYGDGLDKNLIRGDISGIYYKQASEANQASFPEGLYYLDKTGMVMGYINPTNNINNVIWGNQSGLSIVSHGDTMSKSNTLGVPYTGGNAQALMFNNQGLPIIRASHKVLKVNPDYSVTALSDASGSYHYYDTVQDGYAASNISIYVYGGVNNFVAKGDNIFILDSYTLSAGSTYDGARLMYLNYDTNETKLLMGNQYSNGQTPDITTPGPLMGNPLHDVCNNRSTCFMYYDDSNDRLYFSEYYKLRYIDKVTDPTNSSLHTLDDSFGRRVLNWTFTMDKSKIFYISSGKLFCKNITSADAWCDNSDLGPASGLSSLADGPNQLTWKNSTTLLISNYKGEIYQYKLP